MRGLFFFVIFRLGVDSWRERAISEVRGLRDERGPTQLGIYTRTSTNTRHLLTICTQKATRFDKGSCRSRCCGQAGNSLSCPALSWTSLLDSRASTGMTEEKKKTRKWCHPRTSAARSGDLWIFGSYAQRNATVGCSGQVRTWQKEK